MPSVLFICTANRFRSPLAAAWFQRCVEAEPDAQAWSSGSAGTWAEAGQPVIPSVQWFVDHFGLDLSAHRSQRIDRELLARYDLILVMESSHREALLVEFPEAKGRLFLVPEVAVGRAYDIPDPVVQPDESFLDVATELRDLIGKGCGNILRLARQLRGGPAA